MVDVFEEVEEQLRSDRYKALALKILPWAAGALALALAAAIGWKLWDDNRLKAEAKASNEYSQALDAFEKGQIAEAQTLWTEVSQGPSKAYKALALQHLGGLKLQANDTAGAVKLFDEAAAASPEPVLADSARLKAAFALLDTASFKDIQARLDPLTKPDRPYRVEAREALAFAKLMAGDTAGARGDFVVISISPDAQDGARNRAKAAMALIDSGSAKLVPAVAKAALALPPPPQPAAAPAPALELPQQQDPTAQ